MKDISAKAKELTVGQVKEVLASLENKKELHTVEFLFPDGVPALAVSLSTGLSLEELNGDIPVSEMKELIEEVRDANGFFLEMMAKLTKVGSTMETELTAT